MKHILTILLSLPLLILGQSSLIQDTARIRQLEKTAKETGSDSVMVVCAKQMEIIVNSINQKDLLEQKTHCLSVINSIYGIYYSKEGDYKSGLKHYYTALKYAEQINDSSEISSIYHNIGMIYKDEGDTSRAIRFFKKSLGIAYKIKDSTMIAYCFSRIANILVSSKKYNEAKPYIFEALDLRKKLGKKSGIANSYMSAANYYMLIGSADTAIKFFNLAMKIHIETGNKANVSNAYYMLGKIYLEQKNNPAKAKEYGLKSLEIANEISRKSKIMDASLLLYQIYKKTGDTQKSLQYFENYTSIKDSLNSADNKKELIRKELEYSYGKRAVADSVKFAQAQELSDVKIQKQKTQRNALYAGLIGVLIFAGILFNRFRIISKQKNIIASQKALVEEKQNELLASIRYAKKIQQTLLTSEKYIQQNMNRLNKH